MAIKEHHAAFLSVINSTTLILLISLLLVQAPPNCWSYGTKAEINVSTICYLSLMPIY